MLDERRLRTFAKVVETGSIVRAAEALSFTPPAVSQQIAALERQVGQSLFSRGPRGMELLRAGEILLELSGEALDRLDIAEATMRSLANTMLGPIRVSSFGSAGWSLVPRAFSAHRENYPHTALSYAEAEPEDAIEHVKKDLADVALTYTYDNVPLAQTPTLISELVLREPIGVVLPEGHPLAGNERISLEDLAEESWILGRDETPCTRATRNWAAASGFEPQAHFRSNDYATVFGFVGAGLGIALVPALSLVHRPSGVEYRPIKDGDLARNVWAVIRPPVDGKQPAPLGDLLKNIQRLAWDLVRDQT
ncbi:LysR family transcriptional regulator [Nocardiopsis sp. EMB25]|uniref:LysR family transcriptional regulator n=1 Tax=Nocardiopsis sp. EMB25 TaxID=2835867 RepID=UPI002283BB90|nr:LysR family transcriptional regulator [Nocardiopsis sp. EMB25]MCY9786120.1 LysR family transcriptional regulator [Nocardiopsis sp. EMB25]